MATSSSPKKSAATICSHAASDTGFKACCMKSGAYDGSNRDDYFQGIEALYFVAGRSRQSSLRGASATKQSSPPCGSGLLRAEPVIGRAFARPVDPR
jgi:hypothetical protein